jgi:hypothetical protein
MANGNTLIVNVSADQQPVANAQVAIQVSGARLIQGSTDATGTYTLSGIVPGTTYEVILKALGMPDVTKTLVAQAGPNQVSHDYPISGSVIELRDNAGNPIAFARSGDLVILRADTAFSKLTHQWRGAGLAKAGSGHEVIWDTTGLVGDQPLEVTITDSSDGSSVTLRQIASLSQPIAPPVAPPAQPAQVIADTGRLDAIPVRLTRSNSEATPDQALWVAIRNRTKAIAFAGSGYQDFIDEVFCVGGQRQIDARSRLTSNSEYGRVFEDQVDDLGSVIHGVGAYELLKTATQAFLLMQCGLIIEERDGFTNEMLYLPSEEATRLGSPVALNIIQQRLTNYLGGANMPLPYLRRIARATLRGLQARETPLCDGFVNGRLNNPCMMELIWSYWQEEGMLVQGINAISLRFQNRRGPGENDPLGHLELSPLRSLNNLLWGYVQDEQHRLSVLRRAHEYDHHYGLKLYGKAVGNLRTADSRSKFIEGFHNLLNLLTMFYKQSDDTTVVADAFPVLNALREVHMELAKGAHNQFGDLPWTARAEMLMQQWLLSRTELREYLQSRPMVPYKEPWMAQADTLKKMMGWTDVSVSHFHDLAVYGEQLLLSIRYGDWVDINDPAQAANWARYWRPEAQGYLHAYRAATGVDLSTPITDSYQAQLRVMQPSALLRQRLSGPTNAPIPALASSAQDALPAPGFRERRAARQ